MVRMPVVRIRNEVGQPPAGPTRAAQASAGEVIALTVDDVRLDSDPPQLHIGKAKFYKLRIVPIHSSTADQLRAYLQERNRVKLRRSSKAFFMAISTPD